MALTSPPHPLNHQFLHRNVGAGGGAGHGERPGRCAISIPGVTGQHRHSHRFKRAEGTYFLLPIALCSRGKAEGSLKVTAGHLEEGTPRSQPPGEVQTIPIMEKACQEPEEQPQSSPRSDEERPPGDHSPEKSSPEEASSDEQSSEEEFFPEELLPELLPEMLVSEERPPQERLSRKDLFEERPPMEQPPCGVGKHKLEEGSFKERLARSRPQFRGDIHGRNLSNEEMIKVAEEMEEMKRVRNKLMIMHWKARRNRPYPI